MKYGYIRITEGIEVEGRSVDRRGLTFKRQIALNKGENVTFLGYTEDLYDKDIYEFILVAGCTITLTRNQFEWLNNS